MAPQPVPELAAPGLLADPTWRDSVGELLRVLWYEVNDHELTKRLGSLLAHPDYRLWCARQEGRGLGRALVGRVEDWAQDLGAARVKVQSGNDRHDAHRFYGGIGYLATGVRFTKDRH